MQIYLNFFRFMLRNNDIQTGTELKPNLYLSLPLDFDCNGWSNNFLRSEISLTVNCR